MKITALILVLAFILPVGASATHKHKVHVQPVPVHAAKTVNVSLLDNPDSCHTNWKFLTGNQVRKECWGVK